MPDKASDSGERSGIKKAISESTPVTIGFALAFIGFAFWMGIQHNQLSELNTSIRELLKDHEARLRILEKRP